MSYLMAPLYAHFDSGFGATGEAFKEAADRLSEIEQKEGNKLWHTQLPINYLYRHAIELFLKSAIVIFHRRFKLAYGEAPYDADPMVKVGDKWKPFNHAHSIAVLWAYVNELFDTYDKWLLDNTKCNNWKFDPTMDALITIIEEGDPRSTFFRYPTIRDPQADVTKSIMKEVDEATLADAFKNSNPPENRVLALVVQDEDTGDFIRGYKLGDEGDTKLDQALKSVAETLGGYHAALRFEVTNHQ